MGDPLSLMAAVGGAGAAGGAIAGARGTPDQVNTQTGSSENYGKQQTTFGPQSAQEQMLRQQSLNNYLAQQGMAQNYEQNIAGAQGIQNQAQAGIGQVLGGQAFSLTPQEQQAIQAQRDAMVGQSTADINKLLDQRLMEVGQQAGERGVRGQALSQLQGDQVRTAAEQYGNSVRQADLLSAQQSLSQPYQRVAAQSPFLQQGANFASQMQLQAQQNRLATQNPYLLNLLNDERLKGGITSTDAKGYTSGQDVGKGEAGSFWGAVQGGLQGAAAGASAGSKAAGGMK